MKHGRRIILIGIGTLALSLGVLGVFLPLLPTTPFLLLAAACYTRSSPRFYHWLIHHHWLGEYIRNYREHRAIKLRAKVSAIVILWLAIFISMMAVDVTWIRLLLVVIAAGVTVHLLTLRTIKS
ncbi:YbaN family protein [Dehalogenimonas sp. 4OHTPN]|uniref:YbaN family protein n=1 Tax=Dehalogenimonas sp. 4OHTPN TaxID=3166643 RepID=A0AAU8GB11_9CHLR